MLPDTTHVRTFHPDSKSFQGHDTTHVCTFHPDSKTFQGQVHLNTFHLYGSRFHGQVGTVHLGSNSFQCKKMVRYKIHF